MLAALDRAALAAQRLAAQPFLRLGGLPPAPKISQGGKLDGHSGEFTFILQAKALVRLGV